MLRLHNLVVTLGSKELISKYVEEEMKLTTESAIKATQEAKSER